MICRICRTKKITKKRFFITKSQTASNKCLCTTWNLLSSKEIGKILSSIDSNKDKGEQSADGKYGHSNQSLWAARHYYYIYGLVIHSWGSISALHTYEAPFRWTFWLITFETNIRMSSILLRILYLSLIREPSNSECPKWSIGRKQSGCHFFNMSAHMRILEKQRLMNNVKYLLMSFIFDFYF